MNLLQMKAGFYDDVAKINGVSIIKPIKGHKSECMYLVAAEVYY